MNLQGFNELFKANSIRISEKWLRSTKKYELKVLIFLCFKENSKHFYRGNLKEINQFLGVASSNYANKNLRKAIDGLKSNGFINYTLSGRTYEISKVELDGQYLNFPKDWINLIKTYNKDDQGKSINKNLSIDWIQVLRVMAYSIINIDCSDVFCQKELADDLNVNADTIGLALKIIKEINFQGFGIMKQRVVEKISPQKAKTIFQVDVEEPFIITKGTRLNYNLYFDEINDGKCSEARMADKNMTNKGFLCNPIKWHGDFTEQEEWEEHQKELLTCDGITEQYDDVKIDANSDIFNCHDGDNELPY